MNIMQPKMQLPPLNQETVNVAKDQLSIVTTLLLSPGLGASSPKTFYAHYLMRMNVIWTNKLPTAGVSVTDKINFYINPDFFMSLNTIQQMELVEHEVEHVVYRHPLRAKDYFGTGLNSKTAKLYNISADATINENKPNLTADLGVTFKRLNDQLKQKGSKDQVSIQNASEVNYEILNVNMDEEEAQGAGDTVDDHGVWEESSDNKELAEAVIRDAANKAQQSTGIGNMPKDMLKEIADMNKATVNWRRELRQFFVRTQQFSFERTRSRINRRYGIIQPGRRKKPNLHIAICVDSSGSVSDEAFSQFFAEISEIANQGAEITILDADCQVQSVYKYDQKKPVKRTGMGGTAYSPAITKAKELGVDGIIYFGDMDAADTPTNPKLPFLWAVVGPQNPPADFGRTVRVELEGKRR
jgi:predicted metal-dependent peptidase